MEDRTFVTLTILGVHLEAVQQIMEMSAYQAGGVYPSIQNSSLCYLEFDEVIFGSLLFLPLLVKQGIAYTSQWEAGKDYPAGASYCRFTETGEVQLFTLDEGDENPPINKLMSLINQPSDLRQYILDYHAKTTPLPWTNQAEYGQRYRARQLLLSGDP